MLARVVVLFAVFAAVGCGKKKPDGDTPPPKDPPGATPNGTDLKPSQPTESDEQKAQGVWKLVAVELPPGDPAPPQAALDDVRFVVKDGLLTVTSISKKRFDDYFTFKGNSGVSPKAVDFVVSDATGKATTSDEKPGRPAAPEIRLALYKFEGDELVVASAVESMPAGYRPTEFKAALARRTETNKQHSMVVVLRLKKADAGETVAPNPPPKVNGPFGPGGPRKPSDTRRR